MIGHRHWQYLNGGIHAWAASGGELATGSGATPQASDVSLTVYDAARAGIEDVLAAIDDPEQQIWDVRSVAEHQGLRSGSARAGHIPGAVNLDWLLLKNPDDQQRLQPDMAEFLQAHGVNLSKRLITHCQTHHRSGLSYMVARLLGSTDIRAYDGSWSEWGNRDDVPVAR